MLEHPWIFVTVPFVVVTIIVAVTPSARSLKHDLWEAWAATGVGLSVMAALEPLLRG